MKKVKILGMSLAVVSVLGIGLTGCGGGGGKGGGGLAQPTLINALEVEERTAKKQNDVIPTSSRSLNSVNGNSRINVALLTNDLSKRLSKHTKGADLDSYSLNQVIGKKVDCSNGGTMSINGSENDATISFDQCTEDGETMDGSAYFSMSNYDETIDDYKNATIKFTSDFTMSSGQNQESMTIYSGSYLTIKIQDSNKYKLLINMKATDGNEKYELKYCTYYFNESDSKTEMYQTQGKVYINNLSSYVEYDTSYDMSKTPFVFSNYNDTLESGEIRYNMADNATMKIVVENNTPITYIDVDGDGRFDGNDDLDENKDSTVPPTQTGDISQKNHILIVRNTQPSVCEVNLLESEGAVNPIALVVSSSTTCGTYDRVNDDRDGAECTEIYAEEYKGDITCAVGYDDWIE